MAKEPNLSLGVSGEQNAGLMLLGLWLGIMTAAKLALSVQDSYPPKDSWELTLACPVDMAYLATLNWFLWIKPAGTIRRTANILLQLGLGWFYVRQTSLIPIVVFSYGTLLLSQSVTAKAIGLRGWQKDLRLVRQDMVKKTVSVGKIQAITVVVAILITISLRQEPTEVIEVIIVTVGFGITANLVQQAFIAPKNNLLWILSALVVSLTIIALLFAKRTLFLDVEEVFQTKGKILNVRHWYDGLMSVTLYFVFVSLVPVIVSWLIVKQKSEDSRRQLIEFAVKEVRGKKQPTTLTD